MKLPVEFLDKMKKLMGDEEFKEFLSSYSQPRYFGLRVNTLKVSVLHFLEMSPFELEAVPWTSDGFYYPEGENPGKHPYYHAGLYYIQEPSAMLPGGVIDAKPGERVLDLCAAPGGKTVQIAASMKGKGLLVANDISPDRVKALVKNIELAGIRNAIVTNDTPGVLAKRFEGYFDRILVDAPCSGEGMFRKDEEAVKNWEKYKSRKCCLIQQDILSYADRMLRPGGVLVYSTCTFSPEENERMISLFLETCPYYEVAEIPKQAGMEGGRPHWADGNPELFRTVRLWPHRVKGEGHFVAKLRKKGGEGMRAVNGADCGANIAGSLEMKHVEAFRRFMEENLNIDIQGTLVAKGDNLYILPEGLPGLGGIKVAKFGWYLGSCAGGRFEPSHSMAISLRKEDIRNVIDFSSGSKEVLSYLKGETLMLDGRKGYTAVCVDGFTLGWAKQMGGMLKNLYPKGWRKLA